MTEIKSFESMYFPLTIEQAASFGKKDDPYDVIIVGTGIGGGVLAGALFDANKKIEIKKKILVIEKGGLIFHSHCLNTSRPAGLDENRGQANDTFYSAFKDDYQLSPNFVQDETNHPDWSGGPMYCLGGRSCVWGLFAPRPHVDNLLKHFPEKVREELTRTYFSKAEDLMNIYLPRTKRVHQNLIDSLNMDMSAVKIATQWQWGRIASEFCDDKNFDFAQGAYSTVDKLLEIAMTNSKQSNESKPFKILLNAEVWSLSRDSNTIEVTVQDDNYDANSLYGKDVVLCAGSVNSLAILHRSKDIKLNADALGHLTDHNIYFIEAKYNYKDPKIDRATVGAMKLQTYVQIGGLDAIANISIDASSFLPRKLAKSKSTVDDSCTFIMVFILPEILNSSNKITYIKGSSQLEMHRVEIKGAKEDMSKVVKITMQTLESNLGVKFTELNGESITNVKDLPDDGSILKLLPLGAVAHELGSIPMEDPDNNSPYALTTDLQLRDYPNIRVCDLSVFPASPAANPSLTLAALALRLSDNLSSKWSA